MNVRTDQTDRFDDRLLERLTRLIAERAIPDCTPPKAPPRMRQWRLPIAISAPIITGLAIAAAVLGAAGGTPAFAVTRANGVVTAVISSFQDPTGLEQALQNVGVSATVQLLPPGKDCSAPPSYVPVPISALLSARSPNGKTPIELAGGGPQPLTLVLNVIPPHATLVIESQPDSPSLALRWPPSKKGLSIEGVNGRGIYVVWAEGGAQPCTIINSYNTP